MSRLHRDLVPLNVAEALAESRCVFIVDQTWFCRTANSLSGFRNNTAPPVRSSLDRMATSSPTVAEFATKPSLGGADASARLYCVGQGRWVTMDEA